MSTGQGSGGRLALAALLLVPVLMIALLLSFTLIANNDAQAACGGPTGAALTVDPASVPQGPLAGYDHEQLVNAAHIMLAARKLGLSARDQQIGVATALGESTLRVLDYGDRAGPDSRGLFQQRAGGAWGSLADRMNPFISATNFFKVEMTIEGRDSMDPTLVSNAVQRNADPYHYAQFWQAAGTIVSALGGIREATPAGGGGSSSTYDLGAVQPQTATVANSGGERFGIKTIGGYRDPGSEQYDATGHPSGLALDFMINNLPNGRSVGDKLAQYLQDNAGDLGVKYLIWRQRIWSPDRADEGWRPMEDRGSPTQNHMDHVHLSLNGTGAAPGCPGTTSGTVSGQGWATPATGPISSPFGGRTSPGGVGSSFHRGIDIAAACDSPIWSASQGQVVVAGPSSGYGNLIEIDHGGGIMTRYGHMYNDGVEVRPGDHVTAGQEIGKVGSNGNSTGCHLHFEVLKSGTQIDPAAYLATVGITIR